jgi:hypothetical protein
MRSHWKNSEIQCNNFGHCRSLLTKVMKTDNMNPIIWWPSNKRYRLALHLCLLLVLPKEVLAERTQAQSANRAPIVILQEDEKEQPIPVGISSVVYDDYSSVAPEAAAKSYCTPPCGLYVAPGPLTLRLVVLRHPPAELAKAVAGKLCREEFAGRGDA